MRKRKRPRAHARLTTQLSANHTCRPATASRHVQRVFTFIAHTARHNPVARNAMGSPITAPASERIGNWWWNAVAIAVASSRIVKQAMSGSPNHCTLPRR